MDRRWDMSHARGTAEIKRHCALRAPGRANTRIASRTAQQGRIESAPRGASYLRGVHGVSTHRTAPITKRHSSKWFESCRSYFALFWSFLLAISEPGARMDIPKKKVLLGIRLK